MMVCSMTQRHVTTSFLAIVVVGALLPDGAWFNNLNFGGSSCSYDVVNDIIISCSLALKLNKMDKKR